MQMNAEVVVKTPTFWDNRSHGCNQGYKKLKLCLLAASKSSSAPIITLSNVEASFKILTIPITQNAVVELRGLIG